MREGYHFTGADVSSLEFAIEAAVQSNEEGGFPPGSINNMLDHIRENQTSSPPTPLSKMPVRNQSSIPAFPSTIVTTHTTSQDTCQKPTTIPSITAPSHHFPRHLPETNHNPQYHSTLTPLPKTPARNQPQSPVS